MSEKKAEYQLLDIIESNRVNKLLEIYKVDPFKARVLYYNDKSNYTTQRLALFDYPNGDFQISIIQKNFGVSVTNRVYSREKLIFSIIYKGGKFWMVTNTAKNSRIIPLTISTLVQFSSQFYGYSLKQFKEGKIFNILKERFGFIAFLLEYKELHSFPFTNVLQKKLFSYKDVMRYIYKSPYPVAKIINAGLNKYSNEDKLKIWKEMRKVLLYPEKITPELFEHHLFIDTCKMAATLNRKVNCGWGIKRLKAEHDKWSDEITNIILETEPLRDLRIRKVYIEFQKFSGFRLLKTNKDLLSEGIKLKHCVGTYINMVDSGTCGIYHVDGGTLQLGYDSSQASVSIIQFRAYKNEDLPIEIKDKVKKVVSDFNILLFALSKSKDTNSKKLLEEMNHHPNKPATLINNVEVDFHEMAVGVDYDF